MVINGIFAGADGIDPDVRGICDNGKSRCCGERLDTRGTPYNTGQRLEAAGGWYLKDWG